MNRSNIPCFCGSGKSLRNCCEPVINATLPAASAEILMRSRYTAYTQQNEQYLLDTWHSSTRPDSIDMDDSIQWLRLKIINSEKNHVEFIATHRINGKAHKLHEKSRFILEDEKWYYVDGEMKPEE